MRWHLCLSYKSTVRALNRKQFLFCFTPVFYHVRLFSSAIVSITRMIPRIGRYCLWTWQMYSRVILRLVLSICLPSNFGHSEKNYNTLKLKPYIIRRGSSIMHFVTKIVFKMLRIDSNIKPSNWYNNIFGISVILWLFRNRGLNFQKRLARSFQ